MKKINKKNKLVSIKEKKGIKTTKQTRIYTNGDKYVGEFKEGESFFETLVKSTKI